MEDKLMHAIYEDTITGKLKKLICEAITGGRTIKHFVMNRAEWDRLMMERNAAWNGMGNPYNVAPKKFQGIKVEIDNDALFKQEYMGSWPEEKPAFREDNALTVDVGPRRSGKTTRLIHEAARVEGLIVCFSHQRACQVQEHAAKLGVTIRRPLGIDGFMRTHNHVGMGRLLVDDAEKVLADLMHAKVADYLTMTGRTNG
jgi:hypothetical protein